MKFLDTGELHKCMLTFPCCRTINNHCFRKSSFLESYEDFQFIVEESLLSESEEEIVKNIENLVKSEGFMVEKDMDVHANITIICQGNDEWVLSNDERFK